MVPFMPAGGMSPVSPGKMPKNEDLQVDEILIEIDGVVMKMFRRSTLSVPAEVSAIIPRVEIRNKTFENGQLVSEHEMILNSITIVHSPRHPLAGESPPGEEVGENTTVFSRVVEPGGTGVDQIVPAEDGKIIKETRLPRVIVNGRAI